MKKFIKENWRGGKKINTKNNVLGFSEKMKGIKEVFIPKAFAQFAEMPICPPKKRLKKK